MYGSIIVLIILLVYWLWPILMAAPIPSAFTHSELVFDPAGLDSRIPGIYILEIDGSEVARTKVIESSATHVSRWDVLRLHGDRPPIHFASLDFYKDDIYLFYINAERIIVKKIFADGHLFTSTINPGKYKLIKVGELI